MQVNANLNSPLRTLPLTIPTDELDALGKLVNTYRAKLDGSCRR